MLPIKQLSLMVKQHLGLYSYAEDIPYSIKWAIVESPLAGRGLIATEDIKTGDVLFVDHPLVYGPRSGTIIQRGCTVCNKTNSDAFFKCHKCALLICSKQCQNSGEHFKDCCIISSWLNKLPVENIDDTLLSRALAAIRALSLSDEEKNFLTSLQANIQPQHGSEIRNLKDYFEIPSEEEEFMILVSCVLDANAFQIATPYGKREMSTRGLYPISSLMNHSCVPNTRYSFDSDRGMTVTAVKPIRAGLEIFACYSGMLWGTPARRLHLYKTKHFLCMCERCADPTERGTLLAALKCFNPVCPGSLLPVEPLKCSTAWRCFECNLRVPSNNISAIQSALGSLVGSLDFDNIGALEKFVTNRATKYIPKTNQIIVDLQCRILWEFGESEELRFHELSESRLALKESLCRDILRILACLGAGDAHLRGLLLYHLHAALAERARRSPELYEMLKSEIESTIDHAYKILQGDISAPPDLEIRHRYLGPGCEKPQEERFFIFDEATRYSF